MYKDRGLMKWSPAAFLPEQSEILREAARDSLRRPKPEIDDYQLAEFDDRILLAMEFAYFVSVEVWREGFVSAFLGRVCRLDEVGKIIYVELETGGVERIKWAEVCGVFVFED
ncbi:YolD-like family protein [Bacillus sp. JJ722]|uniref:YolD-like family protein n=1 Tax=Bacillus sp. JJ722 TaxID=3122973 RepID=UPI002FFDB3D3